MFIIQLFSTTEAYNNILGLFCLINAIQNLLSYLLKYKKSLYSLSYTFLFFQTIQNKALYSLVQITKHIMRLVNKYRV